MHKSVKSKKPKIILIIILTSIEFQQHGCIKIWFAWL